MPGPAVALVGGAVDTGGAHPAVVVVLGRPGTYCSATKIAPRRFLTAGHCVVDGRTGALSPAFRHDAALQISNSPIPRASEDFIRVYVEQTYLPPAFEQGLQRFTAYKRGRVADFNRQMVGPELQRRIENLQPNPHFTAKFPDAAIFTVQSDTATIPHAALDLTPPRKGDPVTLVGYGCDDFAKLAETAAPTVNAVRRFGTSEVIRADPVNFYSFGRVMRSGAPSLCVGDSGGPVLRDGKVVGVHGTVHGVVPRHGANSNMSVNLSNLASWSALQTDVGRSRQSVEWR